MRSTFRKTFAKYVTLFIVPVVAFSCLFVYINMRTNKKSATNYLDGVQKQMCGELDILYSALENMALHMSGNDAILNFDALSDVEKNPDAGWLCAECSGQCGADVLFKDRAGGLHSGAALVIRGIRRLGIL